MAEIDAVKERCLVLEGDEVDTAGHVYPTTLRVAMHIDGAITGVSIENGTPCELMGTWVGDSIKYKLKYNVYGHITYYVYEGVRVHSADDEAEQWSGTWKYEKKSADEDDVEGTFQFCTT